MSHYSESIPTTPRATTWQDSAACTADHVDTEWFHAGERDPIATENARSVCTGCPVRTACLVAAYAEGDGYALRAGLTPRQRAAFLRKAEGDVARAVADALEDTVLILQQIYRHHAKPTSGGHVIWTDTRHFINVRSKPYTVHRLAWIALHGAEPVGHVTRSCDVDRCVAAACLTDRRMRDETAPSRKKAAV